jgi:transcriptional regulator with XRE-family HTH domain
VKSVTATNHVRWLRRAHDWTIDELADRAELPYKTVWLVEIGARKRPQQRTRNRIAAAFGVVPTDLFPED